MTIKTLGLCLATIAIGGFALAAQRSNSVRQDDAILPATDQPAIHVYRADRIAGSEIMGAGDVPIGKLDALIIDSTDGHIAYAVVSEGGMLGVGERRCLVPWISLYFTPKHKPTKKATGDCEIRTLITAEQLAACPAYKKGGVILAAMERQAFVCASLPDNPSIGQGEP